MLPPKVIIIGGIIIAILIYIATIVIDPYPLFQEEFGWIPSIANWDVYFVTVLVPLVILYRLLFNASGRAINPINKRYTNTAETIIILVIVGGVWYYLTNAIFIPDLKSFFYSNLNISFSSDIRFLFYTILSITVLPLLCVAIAAPVKTAIALRSLIRWFFL